MRAASAPPSQLRFDGVSVAFGGRRVLTDVSFVVPAGGVTGLVGGNGTGKSTLLAVAAGLVEPTAGSATVTGPAGAPSVGLLHQEPPFGPCETLDEAVGAAVAPARSAAAAVQAAGEALAARADAAAERALAGAIDAAERLGAWDVDARVASTLAWLGLAEIPGGRATGSLSGGERARLSLAWLLLRAPDVLLLDEPTNHLDDAAAERLAGVLGSWPGPVLAASHDRAFLDESATGIVDLDPAPIPHAVAGPLAGDGDGSGIGVVRFGGGLSEYLAAREAASARWARRFRDEQDELRRLRAAVRDAHTVGHPGRPPRSEARASVKFYSDRNAKTVARRVNDREARLAELEASQIRKPPPAFRFGGLVGDGRAWSGRADAGIVAAGVAVDGALATVSLAVGAGERLLVTGPNGAGKSTLLRVLAGELAPDAGAVSTPGGASVGLLAQDAELPDPGGLGAGRTVAAAYADLVGTDLAERVPLGATGLVAGRDEHALVAALSVGQRRRLALAVLLASPPDVLLLDEPSNHLSLDLVAAIERAIGEYPGAVVVASHDRRLRRDWRGGRLELAPAV